MQRAEMEELRHREANNTALQAIGPRKKLKLDPETSTMTVMKIFYVNQKYLIKCIPILDCNEWKRWNTNRS